MGNPIRDGVVTACYDRGVDMKYVPFVESMVLQQEPRLQQVQTHINNGSIKVR